MFEKISIIGSGNVASLIARRLSLSGKKIVQVSSKNINHARVLADKFDALATDKTSKTAHTESDLIIVAVNDDSLALVAQELGTVNVPVVHTSGLKDLDVFKDNTSQYGKFYPLQSITMETNDEVIVPICIASNDIMLENGLFNFALSVFDRAYIIEESKFSHLHLSAVLFNNFSNALFGEAYDILNKNRLDFEILIPLIEETVNRIKKQSPHEVQTGPAIRGDQETMQNHVDLLKSMEREDLVTIYALMSDLIKSKNG